MSHGKTSDRAIALWAGILYLVIAVFGIVAMLWVPSVIVVAGDAAATADNLVANLGLYRFGLVSETIVVLGEIALTALLYVLFKPVSAALSAIAAFARLGMTVIQGLNMLNHLIPLTLLGGAAYLSAFGPGQLEALTLLFLNTHADGILVWQIFFGLHLILLGSLAYISGFVPRWIGILLLLGALGYLLDSYTGFIAPGTQLLAIVSGIFLAAATIGELAFAIWLLLRGGKQPVSAHS